MTSSIEKVVGNSEKEGKEFFMGSAINKITNSTNMKKLQTERSRVLRPIAGLGGMQV
jgi:hypothetical protein